MLDFPRWKQLWYWIRHAGLYAGGCCLAQLLFAGQSASAYWPDFLPEPMINLGLDLAGGSHMLLEANPDQVRRQRLENMEESVRSRLRQSEPRIRVGDISSKDGRLSFMLENPAQVDAAREADPAADHRRWPFWPARLGHPGGPTATRFVLTPTQAGIDQAVGAAMDTATEVDPQAY